MDAESAWRRLGGFGDVGEWHPMLKSVDSESDTPGAMRIARGADGGTQIERLEAYDAERHAYRYTIEETEMPVRDYQAEFRIDADPDGESRVTWRAQFDDAGEDPSAGTEAVREFLHAGVQALEERYG
jgi:mxaD protein